MPTYSPARVTRLFGLPEVAKTGRDRLIAVAIDLFYTHGFNAIGIDRILAEAGVTKTTFYKHFESKEDLMVAAMRQRDEWENAAWLREVHRRAGDDPVAQLLAFFDVLHDWFNDPAFGGCIFINGTVEFPDPRDPVHQVAAQHKRNIRDHFRALAVKANAASPDLFADCYTALLEGALILRQSHDRKDAAHAVRPAVEQLIATMLRPAVAPRPE